MDIDERKAKAQITSPTGGREVRRLTSQMECRTSNGVISLRGLASSTESPYDMGGYLETMKRGAFTKTLSETPDVQLLLNHEGLPLARTTNGSLSLREEDAGLLFDATGDETDPDMAAVARKVNAGLMDQCSFAFRVIRQKWNWVDDDAYARGEQDSREIQEVSLDRGDVSVVNYGANPNTSVMVRSLLDEWDKLSPDEIMELRRKLGIPTVVLPEGPDPLVTNPPNLDLYRARAFALSIRK